MRRVSAHNGAWSRLKRVLGMAMLQGRFSGTLTHQLERLFGHGTATGMTESELVERFVAYREEAAFEASGGTAWTDGPGCLPPVAS